MEGDVVRVWIRGDNGEEKRRFCVIMERVPPGVPQGVMLMFGCSNTKSRSNPERYLRIEDTSAAFKRMSLENSTTFHLEDTRGFDAHSPQLKRIGRMPPKDFIELRRLYDTFKAEGHPIQVLPDKARELARTTLTAHMGAAAVAPDPGKR